MLKKGSLFSLFLWFSFVLTITLVSANTSFADVAANSSMENYIANNPTYQFNSYNDKLQKSIGANPPSLIFSSAQPTQPYLGSESPEVFRGRGYYFPQELYTKKETLDFIKEKKDTIQTFGKLFDIPVENDPILLLEEAPKNHIDLGGVEFTGPPNGSLNETIERAKAYAYYKFGSQKMLVMISNLHYNLSSVGTSGGNLGTGTVQGEFTHNAGIAPSTGVTASTVYRTPVVKITCYSNKPIPDFPSTSLNLLEGSKQLLLKNLSGKFSAEQEAIINHNVNLLVRKALAKSIEIEILAFSPSGKKEDIENLKPTVKEVMDMIGSRLYRAGLSEEFLDTAIKSRVASIKNPKVSQVLRRDNAIAGIVINVN